MRKNWIMRKGDLHNMSKTFINSSALFTNPSILKGMVRMVDLFGYLDDYNYKKTEAEADTEALKRDWTIVGLDIKTSIGLYEKGEKTGSAPANSTPQSATR